ncbi:L-amino acid N-acyltransferase YncA [Actinopolyspora mzabensis]|uniref:L-amino acid N-acyltransferase YncA n=1 Tax=Actinopolyspora mzabensis TaxID=995066 RepID=A0A1G8YFD4_ACTMZ|nr:L-amino acid N-acyltransferase YncA [Actinopolyspora mzabensis]
MNIRPARVPDAHALGEIHVASWRAAYAGLVPAESLDRLSVTDRRGAWRERLRALPDGVTVLVAESRGHVLGFAVIGASRDRDAERDTGELQALYLHPRHWRRGSGTRLHEHALRVLHHEGYASSTLWVLTTNNRARGFYEHRGWECLGSTRTETLGDGDVRVEEVRYRYVLTFHRR